jgi:hypothetical protein
MEEVWTTAGLRGILGTIDGCQIGTPRINRPQLHVDENGYQEAMLPGLAMKRSVPLSLCTPGSEYCSFVFHPSICLCTNVTGYAPYR